MMMLISQNLKSTKQFLVHLLRLNVDGPVPLAIKTLAGNIISRLNKTACNCEEQLHELPKYKCKFQHIVVEVSGADTLANLKACHAYTYRPT
jgi:hypothetical protein